MILSREKEIIQNLQNLRNQNILINQRKYNILLLRILINQVIYVVWDGKYIHFVANPIMYTCLFQIKDGGMMVHRRNRLRLSNVHTMEKINDNIIVNIDEGDYYLDSTIESMHNLMFGMIRNK